MSSSPEIKAGDMEVIELAAATPDGDTAHARPDHPLTVAQARRIMQQHKDCRAVGCLRKASALRCLVQAGKLVPASVSPRERAAARGLAFPLAEHDLPVRVGPNLRTLLDVLDALTDPAADCNALTARRSSDGFGSCPQG